MHFFKKIILAFLLHGSLLYSLDPLSELNISAGFRHDQLLQKNRAKLGSFGKETDKVTLRDLDIWLIGINGRLMVYQMDTCFENSYIGNFYFAGFGYWGCQAGRGKLHERIKRMERVKHGKANLWSIFTNDFQGSCGYLFDFCTWAVGISAGYSFDTQLIKTRHGKLTFPHKSIKEAPLYRRGYRTETNWQGPWIGEELFYDWCGGRYRLGYEYHFARYHVHHSIPHTPRARKEGLSYRTSSHNAGGHVLLADGRYYFCDGWEAALYFKFQYWRARRGRLKPTHRSFESSGTKGKASGRWTSFATHLDVGYSF